MGDLGLEAATGLGYARIQQYHFAVSEGEPMSLTNHILENWCRFQGELFPEIESTIGPFLENHTRFVTVLQMVCPERFIRGNYRGEGRLLADQVNLARAFLAKAMWNLPTTRDLIERLEVDPRLRKLCGWIYVREIPSESLFSRAFAEFAQSDLAGQMHEALVKEALGDSIVGHVSRDSTAIPVREKPVPKAESDEEPMKRKRGLPRKGEVRPPKAKTRLERQTVGDLTLKQMLDDLPKDCNPASPK